MLPTSIVVRDEYAAKRLADVVVAATTLVLLSPLLLCLAVAVKFSSPGPVFYCGLRVGRGGQEFGIYKFRSMRLGEGWGITAAGDPRITPLGRLLRRTKLDELPQLFNVLQGTMSIVGPRPEDPRYLAYYTPAQLRVLSARPGITGPTQLVYRDEESLLTAPDPLRQYVEEIMPRKLASDLRYIEQQSFRYDLILILYTMRALLK